MAALDEVFARDLVAAFNSAAFANGATASYARDVDIETAAIAAPTIYVDATLSHRRLDRSQWAASVTLTVSAAAPQTKAGTPGTAAVEAEKAAWLAFIDDDLLAICKAIAIRKRKPAGIEFLSRMQSRALREDRRFVTRFQLTFPTVQ